jgi:hypothetical protein
LQDYVKCNACGWDTRMNAQDVIDKWGPKIDVPPGAADDAAKGQSHAEPSPSATEEVLADMDAAMPSAEDLDAVAVEQKVAEDTAPEPRRGKKQHRG